jgi:hypothetical protein
MHRVPVERSPEYSLRQVDTSTRRGCKLLMSKKKKKKDFSFHCQKLTYLTKNLNHNLNLLLLLFLSFSAKAYLYETSFLITPSFSASNKIDPF